MVRLKRKFVPRDMFISEHGTEMYVSRYLTTLLNMYGITRQYHVKKVRKSLKQFKIWVGMDGYLRIRTVKWLDYKPPKWSKDYEGSIIEGAKPTSRKPKDNALTEE